MAVTEDKSRNTRSPRFGTSRAVGFRGFGITPTPAQTPDLPVAGEPVSRGFGAVDSGGDGPGASGPGGAPGGAPGGSASFGAAAGSAVGGALGAGIGAALGGAFGPAGAAFGASFGANAGKGVGASLGATASLGTDSDPAESEGLADAMAGFGDEGAATAASDAAAVAASDSGEGFGASSSSTASADAAAAAASDSGAGFGSSDATGSAAGDSGTAGSSSGDSGSAGGDSGSGGGEGGGGDGGGWAEGGIVTADRLQGPNPAGPDDGYGGLDAGEFVVNAAATSNNRGMLEAMNASTSGDVIEEAVMAAGDQGDTTTQAMSVLMQQLSSMPRGGQMVEQYQQMAPLAVMAISQKPDAAAIYSQLYHEYIGPAAQAVMAGNINAALKAFSELMGVLGPLASEGAQLETENMGADQQQPAAAAPAQPPMRSGSDVLGSVAATGQQQPADTPSGEDGSEEAADYPTPIRYRRM